MTQIFTLPLQIINAGLLFDGVLFGEDLTNFKVTRHLCFKNSKYLRPQDIPAFNLANKSSFSRITSLNIQKLQFFAIF